MPLFYVLFLCSLFATPVKLYEDGKLYMYDYQGKVSTGVVDESEDIRQVSGFELKAKLYVQKTKEKELLFRLSNVTLTPFNHKVEEFPEFFNLSYDSEDEEKNVHSFLGEMELPFWVEFHQDAVTQTEFPFGSWKTTVNVKNALAALFQIKLAANLSIPYTVMEDGVIGKCPLTYHLPENETINFTKGVKLTKVFDYGHCKYTSRLFFSSINGGRCGGDDGQLVLQNPLKTVASINYNLRGSRQRIVIELVQSNSALTFTPFTSNGQTVLSTTNQELRLVSVIENGKSIKKPPRTNTVTSLNFQFYGHDEQHFLPVELAHSHYYDRVHWIPHTSPTQRVEQIISKIISDFKKSGLEADSVIKLVDELTFFEYDDFVQVFDKNYKIFEKTSSSAKKEMKFILLEILPFVGTNPAVVYILNIIKRNVESDLNLAHLLMQLPFYVKAPSDSLIDHYLEFVQFSIDGRSELLRATAWYTFGTLLYRGCERSEFNPRPKFLPTYLHPEKCAFLLQNLIETFYDASDDQHQQRVYLRVITNTRMSDVFEFLKDVVVGKYPVETRRIAIKGMINVNYDIADRNSQIISLLVPILLDKNEMESIRISAFDVVIQAHSKSLPEIVQHLQQESNINILSYVYSTLQNYAMSTDPCHEKIALDAKLSLKNLTSMKFEVRQPTINIFSAFNEKYNIGQHTKLTILPGNGTFIPSEIILSHTVDLLGHSFDLWEWSFQHENFEELDLILAVLFQKYGLFSRNNITDAEIHKMLNLLKNKNENISNKFTYTKKLFNQYTYSNFLFDFDPSRHVTAGGGNKHTAFTLRNNKITYLNMEYVVGNDMGFPLTLQLNLPLIVKSRGTFTLKSELTSAHEELPLAIPLVGSIDLDLTVGLDLAIHSRMSVAASFLHFFGYQVIGRGRAAFPLRVSTHFDYNSKHFDVNYVPPYEHSLISLESIPSTFGGLHHVLPITTGNKTRETLDVGLSYFGFGFSCNLIHYNYWNDYASFNDFFDSLVGKMFTAKSSPRLAHVAYALVTQLFGDVIVNPSGKNFAFKMDYKRSKVNPTNELTASVRKSAYKYYDDEKTRKDRWSFSKYDLEIVANGPIERKWLLELHWSAQSPPEQWKRVRIHFQRTSLPNFDEKPFAFCIMLNHQTFYSKIFTNPLSIKQEDPNMSFQLSFTLGNSCERYRNSIRVTINGKMIKSLEQLHENTSRLPFYQKCQLDQQQGFKLSPQCWRVKQHLGRLNRIELNVQYQGLSKKQISRLTDTFSWLEDNFLANFDVEESEQIVDRANNLLKIAIDFSSRQQNVDISIMGPHKITAYKNVSLPQILPVFPIPSVAEPFWQVLARNIFGYQKPMCFISGDLVRTVNQLIYHYKLNSCFHLALANCHSKRLLLFFRSIRHDSFSKSLRMLVDKDTIDIDVADSENSLVAYVNGKKIISGEYVKFVEEFGSKLEAFVIYSYRDGFVVESKYYDITVYFNGNDARVVVSDFLRGRLCGLCGHKDANGVHELLTVRDDIHLGNTTHLTNIYALRDNTC